MIDVPSLKNEDERIGALSVLDILDTGTEEGFDNIVKLAAIIAGSQVSAITFVDETRIWYKAKLGIEWNETPRKNNIANAYAFFYAVPIAVDHNMVVGHLSVASDSSIELSLVQKDGLLLLAKQIITLLQMRTPLVNNSIKEFYESILNNIPADVVVFDTDHKYLFANPGAIRNDDHRAYIIGKDDFEYGTYRGRDPRLAESRRAKFLEVKRTGKAVGWEETQVSPEGKIITFLRRMFPMYDDHSQLVMVIGFGIDISERKFLEEKQSEVMEQLAMQNTQLLDFCNVVSHNLRGPLINMGMLAEFIKESEDFTEQKDLVSKLEPVVESLKNTFNGLVESIQIRQDNNIKSDILNFSNCLQDTLNELIHEINKVKASISYDFDDAPAIRYPRKYLASIFHNLISNAIKYQSPERKLSLSLASKIKEDKIVLTVKDNGLGIDLAKHRDNIFKIGKVFHRHPDAKGLGLFMTKTQVEAMGGKIWVESYPGQGSTFSIEFVNQNITG